MTYATTVAADSPVGYWRLGDASGPTVTATVGNNLTATNSPTFAVAGLLTGDSDTAMSFVAASAQRAEGSDTGLPTGNSAWSVEAWVKTSSTTEMGVVKWGTDNGTADCVCMAVDNGALAFDTSWRYRAFTTVSLKDDVRHHIVMTYDGTTMRAYADGTASVSTYTLGTMALTLAGASGMRIGRSPGLNYGGTIDEVAIYATELSAARVLAHYTAGITNLATASFAQAAATWDATATYTSPVGGSHRVGHLQRMREAPRAAPPVVSPPVEVVERPPERQMVAAAAKFAQSPATWAAAMAYNDDELVLEMLAR